MGDKREDDLEYVDSIKDGILKWCCACEDPDKIKLSQVKEKFKTIPLNILSLVMEVLASDSERKISINMQGRMAVYSVLSKCTADLQSSGIVKKTAKSDNIPRDKENITPSGRERPKSQIPSKRKHLAMRPVETCTSSPLKLSPKRIKTGGSPAKREANITKLFPQQDDASLSKESIAEGDLEFISLALYRIFDGGEVEVTSLSSFKEQLMTQDATFTAEEVERCLRHLQKENKIMLADDEILLI